MTKLLFKPGFRIDTKDVLAILLGGAGAWYMAPVDEFLALVIALSLGHFFLFCNVFRLARPRELAWAVFFVVLCSCQITLGKPGVLAVLLCTLVATVIVIGAQMRDPAYHGVGWQRINPKLPDWWKNQYQSKV